mmetsp:Transcript_30881/g.69474  ORF Transcript_30881/g.69474 Transcript_30881/m.69474 type:complete len:330 (+) Transcript_30881:286-1275(+)
MGHFPILDAIALQPADRHRVQFCGTETWKKDLLLVMTLMMAGMGSRPVSDVSCKGRLGRRLRQRGQGLSEIGLLQGARGQPPKLDAIHFQLADRHRLQVVCRERRQICPGHTLPNRFGGGCCARRHRALHYGQALQSLQQIRALHHAWGKHLVLHTQVPECLGGVALQVLLGEAGRGRGARRPLRAGLVLPLFSCPLPASASALMLPLPAAARGAPRATAASRVAAAAPFAGLVGRFFLCFVFLGFLFFGQRRDFRQRPWIHADQVGNCPSKVGTFPQSQQQLLAQDLILLEQRLHVPSSLAPSCDEKVGGDFAQLLLPLHHFPLRGPR